MAVQTATQARGRLDLGEAFKEFDINAARFAGTQILATFATGKRESTFTKLTRAGLLGRAKTARAVGGGYNRVDLYKTEDSYKCLENGLEGTLGDDDRALYASEFDAELASVENVFAKVMIEQEIRVKDLIFNTATYTGSALFTDNKATPWSTITTDIIGQVIDAAEKVRRNTGVPPNALVIGATSLANVLKNTSIRAQFPAVTIVTLEMIRNALGSIFGLEKLIVGAGAYNSAAEGQTCVVADTWPKTYAWIGRVAEAGDSLVTPCVGRTFLWDADAADIVIVEQYREEQVRGDVFRCRQYTAEKIFDAYFGHLLQIEV